MKRKIFTSQLVAEKIEILFLNKSQNVDELMDRLKKIKSKKVDSTTDFAKLCKSALDDSSDDTVKRNLNRFTTFFYKKNEEITFLLKKNSERSDLVSSSRTADSYCVEIVDKRATSPSQVLNSDGLYANHEPNEMSNYSGHHSSFDKNINNAPFAPIIDPSFNNNSDPEKISISSYQENSISTSNITFLSDDDYFSEDSFCETVCHDQSSCLTSFLPSPEKCSTPVIQDVTVKKRKKKAFAKYFQGSVTIPANFWEKEWEEGFRLKNGWSDTFNEIIEKNEILANCVFSYDEHKCWFSDGNHHRSYFYVRATCKNRLCTEFSFFVREEIKKPFKDYTALVFTTGEIEHDPADINRREIKGHRRKELAKKLESSSPYDVLSDMVVQAAEGPLNNGNHNSVSELQIIKKISSENNTRDDLDPNIYLHLHKLFDSLRNDEKWKDDNIPGYIQKIGIFPFEVICYSARQLDVIVELSLKEPVILHLDGSGLPKPPPDQPDAQMMYYALLLKGTGELGQGGFPIADYVTNRQSVYSIGIFLGSVVNALRNRVKHRKVVSMIEVDFSIALIQSVLNMFQTSNLSQYLKWNWEFEKIKRQKNMKDEATAIHICSSHLLGTVKRKLSKLTTKNSSASCMAKIIVSQLVHSENHEKAGAIFQTAVEIFCQQYETESVKSIIKSLEIKIIPEVTVNDTKTSELIYDEEDEKIINEDEGAKLRHGSPYWQFFNDIYWEEITKIKENIDTNECHGNNCKEPIADTKTNVKKKDENNRDNRNEKKSEDLKKKDDKSKNKYFLPKFIDYLLEYLLPFYPLWSAVVIKEFNMTRNSNAAVENWFGRAKNKYFNHRKHIPVPRFVRKMQLIIHKALKMRSRSWLSTRQKKNKNKLIRKKPTRDKEIRTYIKQKQLLSEKELASKPWDDVVEVWKFKNLNKKKKRGDNYWFTQDSTTGAPIKCETHTSLVKEINESIENTYIPFHQQETDMASDNLCNNNNSHESSDDTQNKNKDICKKNTSSDDLSRFKIELMNVHNDYPTGLNFEKDKNVSYRMYGEELKQCCWESLQPNGKLCDDVINSFMKYTEDIGKTDFQFTTCICFSTHFSVNILSEKNNASDGYYNWAKKVNLHSYNLWLIPIHINGNHWTLLIVNLSDSSMIYLDSLKGNIPEPLVSGVMKFIKKTGIEKKNNIIWTDWKVYVPKDIPVQENGSMNCGVHVLTWVFIVITSSYNRFTDADMKYIRRGIAKILFQTNTNDRNKKLKRKEINILDPKLCDIEQAAGPAIELIEIVESAPGGTSTLWYLAMIKFSLQQRNVRVRSRKVAAVP